MKSESKVSQEIVKYVQDELGGYVVNVIKANRSGIPDLICCIDGKFVAIEVKKEKGGVVSDLQKYNIKSVIESGGIAFVARSVEDVKGELNE